MPNLSTTKGTGNGTKVRLEGGLGSKSTMSVKQEQVFPPPVQGKILKKLGPKGQGPSCSSQRNERGLRKFPNLASYVSYLAGSEITESFMGSVLDETVDLYVDQWVQYEANKN